MFVLICCVWLSQNMEVWIVAYHLFFWSCLSQKPYSSSRNLVICSDAVMFFVERRDFLLPTFLNKSYLLSLFFQLPNVAVWIMTKKLCFGVICSKNIVPHDDQSLKYIWLPAPGCTLPSKFLCFLLNHKVFHKTANLFFSHECILVVCVVCIYCLLKDKA